VFSPLQKGCARKATLPNSDLYQGQIDGGAHARQPGFGSLEENRCKLPKTSPEHSFAPASLWGLTSTTPPMENGPFQEENAEAAQEFVSAALNGERLL
jgi:hypothetical protein